ncbi:hypothetical protein ASPCADRAFT_129956 [Aspergillus carbonarius ITEM 5010]|uniref:Uncharacterized protein n=1 Tax=Aspergillus carbonarius (strain ITEM 5010) TaxID=602072 RepID=A0A1R3RR00_ASPC5|nr:hypothetical protein ASPCADRAFT_129956 [Aspergillus carbonarius ITEM 5010]
MDDIAGLEREYQSALTEVRGELAEVKQGLADLTAKPPGYVCESQLEKIHVELQSIRATTTCSSIGLSTDQSTDQNTDQSTGKSWASIVTATPLVSPTTRATRADLGLPMIVVEGRKASAETKEVMRESGRVREVISNQLKSHRETENIKVEGVKALRGNSVKISVDSEENTKVLRENQSWLEALPGAIVQGEQWFPIKVDAVPRDAVFDDNAERHDFRDLFRLENEGAEVNMVRWMSGARPYGSMAVYLSKERDAHFLVNRKIVARQRRSSIR